MTQSQRELDRLLSRMRGEDTPDLAPEDEAAREERMAARIDEVVQEAAITPISTRTNPFTARRIGLLLLAASIPFALFFAVRGRGSDATSWIAREPPSPPSAHAATIPTDDSEARPESAPPSEPKPSKAAAAARSTPSARPASAPAIDQAPTSPAALPDPPSAEAARSTLSEENRLFQDAAQAERSGDEPRAIATLDRLVHDFPRSPLAQNAMVRKFRMLARAGRKPEAAAAARDYLRAFPLGFAKPEAEGIANGAPEPAP